jgi:hypothetical protein
MMDLELNYGFPIFLCASLSRNLIGSCLIQNLPMIYIDCVVMNSIKNMKSLNNMSRRIKVFTKL